MTKIRDIRQYSRGMYGYCPCGREIKKGSVNEVKCPLCNRKLVWEDEDNGRTNEDGRVDR